MSDEAVFVIFSVCVIAGYALGLLVGLLISPLIAQRVFRSKKRG